MSDESFNTKTQRSDQPNSGDKIDAMNPKVDTGQLKSNVARPSDYKPPTGITLVDEWYHNKYGRA